MGRPKGPRVTVICPGCGESFEQLPSEHARGRRYCSRACFTQVRGQRNEGRSDGLWTCTKCAEVKSVDDFFKRRSGRPLSQCKACTNAHRAEWAKKNRHRNRGYHLMSKYGVTVEEVDALLKQQGGLCAGCGDLLRGGRGNHLDHCHETGKVRGILCHGCNLALGLVKDNADTLRRLAAYLQAATSTVS